MRDTTNQLPHPAVIHQRFFAAPLLDPDAYRAGFDAVRRALPLREAEAATVAVCINRENLDLFLKAAPVSSSARSDGRR